MANDKSETVTIPRWLYELMQKDSDLVRHLSYYRGWGWIETVKKEMESDREFKVGIFNKDPLKYFVPKNPPKGWVSHD